MNKKNEMSAYEQRELRALHALLDLASTNVAMHDIRIQATGRNGGAITVPAYLLRSFLRTSP